MQPWSKPGNWLQLVVLFLFLWYIISNRSSLSHFHWWSLFSFPLVVIVHLSNWQLFQSGWLSVIVGKHVCNEFISGSVPLIFFWFFFEIVYAFSSLQKKTSQGQLRHLGSEPPPWIRHPTKFSGHKSCESGDIICIKCYVTLCVKAPCSKSPTCHV